MKKPTKRRRVKKVKAWAVIRNHELGETLCRDWEVRGSTLSIFAVRKLAKMHSGDIESKIVPVTITYKL